MKYEVDEKLINRIIEEHAGGKIGVNTRLMDDETLYLLCCEVAEAQHKADKERSSLDENKVREILQHTKISTEETRGTKLEIHTGQLISINSSYELAEAICDLVKKPHLDLNNTNTLTMMGNKDSLKEGE
jgi:hypothetical protein